METDEGTSVMVWLFNLSNMLVYYFLNLLLVLNSFSTFEFYFVNESFLSGVELLGPF